MSEELQRIQTFEVATAELAVARSADLVFKEAEMVSKPWAQRVEKLSLYKAIAGRKHLEIEAWQMLAACYRVTTRVVETRMVDFGEVRGFEAIAEAYHMPTGSIISRAEAMCLSDEDNWGPRPKYRYEGNQKVLDGYVPTPLQQLRSMAQTRAQSKVLANLFKWVAKMQGFHSTPAEEMTGQEYEGKQGTQPPPQRKSSQQQQGQSQGNGDNNNANAISEAQGKRMYAIAKGAGLNDEDYGKFLQQYGFQKTKDVTRDKYEEMIARLESFKEQGQQG